MWPGFMQTTKLLTDGIYLNVDCATKFINKMTVYDVIRNMIREKYSKREIKDELCPKEENAKRLVVITTYNSQIYQIDDMTFDVTPKTHVM